MFDELPRLDACVALYLDVWEFFEDDRFATGDLVVELHERGDDRGVLSSGEPDRYLDLLVAYGLLDGVGGDEYRVRCTPEETELEWRDSFADRAERLYGAVHSVREERSTAGSDERLVTYRGRTYVSVFVDGDTTVGDVAERIGDLVAADELGAGVAIRCPADQADLAQDLADALADPEVVAATACPFPFEKVNSEVRGADSDALQFRLYLAPANRD